MIVPFGQQHKHFILIKEFQSRVLSSCPVFTSILSPFVLIIVLQNYRKPAAKFFNFFKKGNAELGRAVGDPV